MNMEQINELKEAIKNEGNFKSQTYKGIKYEIVRHEHLGHLCGYLHYMPKNEKERDITENNFHGGITYENDGVIGFDCAHASDLSLLKIELDKKFGFNMPRFLNPEYRTMQYVEDILKKTIDNIVSGKNGEPEMSYQWDFEKLKKLKEEQDKIVDEKKVEEMVKTIRKGNFTVISDERLKELHVQEKALEVLLNGTISLTQDIQGVIPND